MTDEELNTVTIDQYRTLQRIKQANGGYENPELNYALKLTAAKLSLFGINIEDITLT